MIARASVTLSGNDVVPLVVWMCGANSDIALQDPWTELNINMNWRALWNILVNRLWRRTMVIYHCSNRTTTRKPWDKGTDKYTVIIIGKSVSVKKRGKKTVFAKEGKCQPVNLTLIQQVVCVCPRRLGLSTTTTVTTLERNSCGEYLCGIPKIIM